MATWWPGCTGRTLAGLTGEDVTALVETTIRATLAVESPQKESA